MTICDRCGFDPTQWDEQDATRTLRHTDDLLDLWLVDLDPALAPRLDARRSDIVAAIGATSPDDLVGRVHHLWHGLVSLADQRRLADDLPPRARGRVTGVHRSDGGVPKNAVDSAEVGVRGLVGDRQATRVHHGRPWQALCLWSAEAIEALAADGHPIGPGSAGENMTLAGLDWGSLRAGLELAIGDVRCQLWAPAVPCSKNARWFSDGDYERIHADRDRAMTRWYASVTHPGTVAVGDEVTLSP